MDLGSPTGGQGAIHLMLHQSPFAQPVNDGNPQHTQTIDGTALEVDAGGFFKIFGRASHFSNLVTEVNDLRKHFVVKHKIIAVDLVIHPLQHFF